MPISTPSLVSSFTAVDEIIAVPSSTEAFVVVIKNHIGSPRRELEVFTVAEVEAGTPIPTRVEILSETFTQVHGFLLSANTARLYWNDRVPDPVSPVIKQADYDLATNTAGAITQLPFFGRDPFVLDARTGANPNDLVITYVTPGGGNAFRLSTNDGASWGTEQFVDADGTGVTSVEANFDDPLGARQAVQVLQRRL